MSTIALPASSRPAAPRSMAPRSLGAAPRAVVTVRPERSVRSMRAVYVRRRLGVAGLLVLGLSTFGYGFADAGTSTTGTAAERGAHGGTVHVVQAGETLWGIARAAHPHGDVRPVVDRLARQLAGDTLVPGSRIVVD